MDVKIHLLDLYFHKYLQYKNAVILIIFSYFIALLIPFLTRQLKPDNFIDMFLITIISSIVFPISIIFLNEFNYHLEDP